MSEADWTRRVIDTAKLYGWHCVHFLPARTNKGWATALQGDKGFPDLVLAKSGCVLHAELKTDTGRVRKDQIEWAKEIGPSYRLWRPRDWDIVLHELSSQD